MRPTQAAIKAAVSRRGCSVAWSGAGQTRRRMCASATGAEGGEGASRRARLGQNFNAAGISQFLQVLVGRNKRLAVPHLEVKDITAVSWSAVRSAGFAGVVFDKDGTLTRPYQPHIEPHLQPALNECVAQFGGKVVLFSNSAGLAQFDPQGLEAERLEAALGIPVLRHTAKKPAGGPEELEAHFGCSASQLVMVGDRLLTDVVFGNRLGMLTVLCNPLSREGEPVGVRVSRRVEGALAARRRRQGVPPPEHPLVPLDGAGLFLAQQ